MIDIKNNGGKITLTNSDKVELLFDTSVNNLTIEQFDVSYPGEYEKSAVLIEVKEYADSLFHHVFIDNKHVVFIQNDKIELKEEILSFFGDVDILIIIGSKDAAKLFESIEAKIVIPFGEGKDVFLNTLGQHIEEVSSHKVKAELPFDTTEFVNLEII
ncbi:MAG: hypothetical protein GY828_08440 [Candidatus Gracilibacteria bacterium]|nr:hypothetical protein [Candidatus Gracilibacteria bacterium]